MSLIRLILVALFGLAADPDPTALIGDLSSTQEAVRMEAAGALEELGSPALPALYRVRDSDNLELRRQVTQLIDLIERQRLLRATKVRLDFEDKPLAEVAESLQTQMGCRVVLEPHETLQARRVSLRAPEPVPFWEALDRLGPACGVRHLPGARFSPSPRGLTVELSAAEGPPVPSSDAGPFRVYFVGLARHREVTPVRPPADPKHRETLSAELHLVAEPGLVVNPIRPFVLEEVVDDRGRDLRPDPPVGPTPRRLFPPRFEEGHASLLSLQIPLKPEAEAGGRIRRFKGHLPISVIARTGDPVVAPLEGEEGKAYSKGGITLSVTDVKRVNETLTLTLTIGGEPISEAFSPRRIIPLGEYQPPYRIEDHLQVQDDQGQSLWWNAGRLLHNVKSGEQVFVVTVFGRDAKPARILYHGVIGAATEVAFEFTDLPLP